MKNQMYHFGDSVGGRKQKRCSPSVDHYWRHLYFLTIYLIDIDAGQDLCVSWEANNIVTQCVVCVSFRIKSKCQCPS